MDYRGYRLMHTSDGVAVYFGREMIEVHPDTSSAEAEIDSWLDAP